MKLVDTHTHLYLPEFDADRDEMINRAVKNGVVKLLMPNIDIKSLDPMLACAEKYPGICYPMTGLHPTSVKEDYHLQLEQLENVTTNNKFIAVGEIGIDLYWDRTFLKEQKEALHKQIEFAVRYGLPVVLHSRESFPEVFSVIDEFSGEKLKGIFHAFSGNLHDAIKAIGMGFKLGIGGPLTFKNSGLDKIAREVGLQNIVLETDSPYLAPVPYRGKRNESSYICIINRKLAEILGKSDKEVADVTYENACRLFNI